MAPSTRLRRATLAAALPLLLVPASAQAQAPASACKAGPASTSAATAPATAAAKRRRAPKVSHVAPLKVSIGDVLEVRGKDFVRGRCRNTVVFQRAGGKAVFVKADLATRKLLKVTLPNRLDAQLLVRGGFAVPTRFKLRVLSVRTSKPTRVSRSPVVAPKPPPIPPAPPAPVPVPDVDTDLDGQLNSVDADDDDDLLSDDQERAINAQLPDGLPLYLDPLKKDTDGDKVEDGYELRSARDLNSSFYLPYPGKRPYANPLDASDAGVDFDGDGLTLSGEQRLWAYESARVGRARSLDELSYSDGTKYSAYVVEAGRRAPGLRAAGYERESAFRAWAAQTGHDRVQLRELDDDDRPVLVTRSLYDVNRDGVVNAGPRETYPYSEASYYDTDENGVLDDGERDEDADGLINVDETEGEAFHRRMTRSYWDSRYPESNYTQIDYKGTRFDDPDSDGDGIRDAADDQDFDDVPNLMELSRSMAVGGRDPKDRELAAVSPHRPWFGRVNPFNPCLPDRKSRTCPRYIPADGAWAPFSDDPKLAPRYFVYE